MKDTLQKIYDYTLEEIMGERFGRYSKYIIQDRAIPDVRDGLKPVQRRILFGMFKQRMTYDRPYNKSAYAVGEVMGKYHPHGDSSIYEAMVRMSQSWKLRHTLIDMQGNNGSMDGDSPAAPRYTEARLSKISLELLRDMDKNTVAMAPNYDDKFLEPTVLPARFPNLLVNGANGISAGYATNIPPHNLGEVIDATIQIIEQEDLSLEELMQIVKGPDFPTGGIVEGLDGIKEAYTTGKGKIIVKSKVSIETNKGKQQLIIKEIPYEVNKANLVKKMEDIRIEKKIDGIAEVRDESDKEGLRIAVDLKKESDPNLILNYLLKNTELQISYHFNMVSINHRRPKLLGIKEMLMAYIEHQKEVVLKRSEFDLAHAKSRLHIVEGLIKAISILDEVIHTIRASKNKIDAENNLVIQYQFSLEQAKAIVELQLYRLTNTDVTVLEEELKNLRKIIAGLTLIIENKEVLMKEIKQELRMVKQEFALPRLTEIKEEVTEIKIDTTALINKEDVIVVITKEGYIKRVSKRSYSASDGETTLKEGDYCIGQYELNTLDTVLLFTDLGNYLYIPVYEIPDSKWKDLGKHVSNIIPMKDGENIVSSICVTNFDSNTYITSFTKLGMIKITKLDEYKALRYSKPIMSTKLKENDYVIQVTDQMGEHFFVGTKNGYGLYFKSGEVPVTGLKTSGVKAISLKDDEVVAGRVHKEEEQLVIITHKGTGKRIKMADIEEQSRARKGNLFIRTVKTNPHYLINALMVQPKEMIGIKTNSSVSQIKASDLPIMDLSSTGTKITKEDVIAVFKPALVTVRKEIESKETRMTLEEIDYQILTIDDFLDME